MANKWLCIFFPPHCVGIFLFRGQCNRLICNGWLIASWFFLHSRQKSFNFSYLPSSLINVRGNDVRKRLFPSYWKFIWFRGWTSPQFDSTTLFDHLIDLIFWYFHFVNWDWSAYVSCPVIQSALTNDWDVSIFRNSECGQHRFLLQFFTLLRWNIQTIRSCSHLKEKCTENHYGLVYWKNLSERHRKECRNGCKWSRWNRNIFDIENVLFKIHKPNRNEHTGARSLCINVCTIA